MLYNYVTFLNKRMTTSAQVVTEDGGRQNMYGVETRPYIDPSYKGYWKNAEQTNGRMAMIGFFAAVHNYILFGAVIPGIF